MQPHPDAQLAQRRAQFLEPGFQRSTAVKAGAVLDILPVSAGILRNHQELLHPGSSQIFGFLQDFADRSADQRAAQRGDDAEAAMMIAAFGNFQIGVMRRRQANPLRRHQTDEGIVCRRQMRMHMLQHFISGMRAGDRQHLRMILANQRLTLAQTAGDNHLAVLGQSLANGFQRLFNRRIDKAAGIDDHQIGVLVRRRDNIAFSTQAAHDLLGINQRLRTTKGHQPDTGFSHGKWLK